MTLADEGERDRKGLLAIGELEHDALFVRSAQGAGETALTVDGLTSLDGDPASDAALKMLGPQERPGDARRGHLELEPLGVPAEDIGDATAERVVDAVRVIDEDGQDSTGELNVDYLDIGELRHDIAFDLVRDGRPLLWRRHCYSFLPGNPVGIRPTKRRA
jgi:hypothetical protein